jgi:hypothetical protein
MRRKAWGEDKKVWLKPTPYWLIFGSLIIVYATAAAYSPRIVSGMDILLTPLTQTLIFFGLGIKKPFMDGAMPQGFYVNLTGISIWGALACNTASVLYFYRYKWLVPTNGELKERMLKTKRNWSLLRAWLTVFLVLALLSIGCGLFFLNGINGWFVFHVPSLTVTVFITIFFLFLPSSLIFASGYFWIKTTITLFYRFFKYIYEV